MAPPHSAGAGGSRADPRGGSASRGYGARWQRFRGAYLAANPLCAYCLADGRIEPATVLDHDIPHRGDPRRFWATTFTGLCKPHHDVDKARAEARLDDAALALWVARRKAGGGSKL